MILRTLSLLVALALPTVAFVHATTPARSATQLEVRSDKAGPRHQAAAKLTYALLSDPRYAYAAQSASPQVGQQVLDNFLRSLDPQRMFLTQADLDALDVSGQDMASAIQGQDLSPALDIHRAWSTRTAERLAHARALLAKGFDFSRDEAWIVRDEHSPRPATMAQSDELWRQYVKNDWLRLRLAGQDAAVIRATLDKRYARMTKALAASSADQVVSTFLNAYAAALDPHTNYFMPVDAQSFNMNMSLSLEGIGAVLQLQDDTTAIRNLIPGGPAAKSGQVSIGDRILAIGQGVDGPMVDVVGWGLDEVVGLVRGARGSVVRLSLAGPGADATARMVRLSRDRVEMEDQQASKKVLDVDGMKVGVVSLPGFYLDFQARAAGQANARSATQDVERLLGQLKAQGIDAVLVDLRGNGGGSLTEAVSLTGLFIDVGPVVQVRMADGSVEVEGDTDPGVAWDGPLAVLVDSNSASASEIFAAAIQDHGRGLVVGENTFGKGTVQSMVDLDTLANAPGAGFGQVKLTIAQFFRISGATTQRDGVHPDVAFAQTLDGDEAGEAGLPGALEPSRIKPAAYPPRHDLARLLPALNAGHDQRVQADPRLRWWLEDVAQFRAQRDTHRISLNETRRRADLDRQQATARARADERRKLGLFVPEVRYDDGLAANERSIAEQVREEAQAQAAAAHDPLLEEAVHVLAQATELDRSAVALAPPTADVAQAAAR